jgi:RNA polymerase sigma-70 factor (ECF subfamily)
MPDDVQELLRRRQYDQALEQLLEAYEQKVYRMAVSILRDRGRAEDVTQDVFLKLWRALPSYDGRAAVSTWLYTIARNTCLSALRLDSYRQTAALDAVKEPGTGSSERLDVVLKTR